MIKISNLKCIFVYYIVTENPCFGHVLKVKRIDGTAKVFKLGGGGGKLNY